MNSSSAARTSRSRVRSAWVIGSESNAAYRRLPGPSSFPPLIFCSSLRGGGCAMRMLVLGAGLQGSACSYDLLRQPGVERVTIADLRPERIPAFLKPSVGKRLALVKLDVQDGAALRAAMADHAAVQNAAPYYFNLEVSRAAVDAAVHCADLGGNTEIVFQQKRSEEHTSELQSLAVI